MDKKEFLDKWGSLEALNKFGGYDFNITKYSEAIWEEFKKEKIEMLDWFNRSVIGYPDQKQRFMVKVKKIEIEELNK